MDRIASISVRVKSAPWHYTLCDLHEQIVNNNKLYVLTLLMEKIRVLWHQATPLAKRTESGHSKPIQRLYIALDSSLLANKYRQNPGGGECKHCSAVERSWCHLLAFVNIFLVARFVSL